MLTDEIEALLADKTHRPSNKCSALHAIDQFEGDDREAIIKLLQNVELRNDLGKSARNFVVEKFSWKNNVKLMIDEYKRLLSK